MVEMRFFLDIEPAILDPWVIVDLRERADFLRRRRVVVGARVRVVKAENVGVGSSVE